MKIQIRKNVIETNSSSMHSLCISNVDDTVGTFSDEFKLKNGIWNLRSDDIYFGRHPFRVLHNIDTKARYVMASLCCYNSEALKDIICKIVEIMQENNSNIKGISFPVVSEPYGIVDLDILSRFLNKHNLSIKEFILNPKYVVIVDGDEYGIFSEMYANGIIDKVNIENRDEVEKSIGYEAI